MSSSLFRQPGYQSLDDELYGEVHDEDIQFSDEQGDSLTPGSNIKWDHIQNLDEFFYRVYYYHQRGGFLCIFLGDVFLLLQFVFVVVFSVFLMQCVNYSTLFQNAFLHGNKTKLSEAVIDPGYCMSHLNGWIVIAVLASAILWLLRFTIVTYSLFKYWEMRTFYKTALDITSDDLASMTWSEVQSRLLAVQKDCQLCVHKAELTELDMYQRILRIDNYMIAMVNKNVLPVTLPLPFGFGDYVFFTRGLKFNIYYILFRTPWSLFENYWHLKPKYKKLSVRNELCDDLSKKFLIAGILNLIFLPLIFLWQILFSFFKYAELVKREPSLLGSRRWSQFGRLYLRHFNELDHEFYSRLNRAYEPASRYMNCFTSQIVTILCKNIMFFAGALLAVLVTLSVIDEDVLHVEHVLTAITLLGILVTISRSAVPNENFVWCPELLMKKTLAHIHYLPDTWNWRGREHVLETRTHFSTLFQYKVSFLLEELFSPLITPLLLIFVLRRRAGHFIDFFRNYTVEVAGVGDICSFAQLDVDKHGSPDWNITASMSTIAPDVVPEGATTAKDGKTELSLMHFHLTNPSWKPTEASQIFLNNIRASAQQDMTRSTLLQQSSMVMDLAGSFHRPEDEDNLLVRSQIFLNVPPSSVPSDCRKLRGSGVRAMDCSSHSITGNPLVASTQFATSGSSQISTEMSLSTLYLHELHHRRMIMLTSRLEPTPEEQHLQPVHSPEQLTSDIV